MPAATPIPRAPAILTLDTAAALLTGPGCPVCRYADEAGDRYFAWFAFEAHAQAHTLTRLCASLGMCPPHTRTLMRQPGAEVRLTAVCRYLVQAARDRLTGPAPRLDRCPACNHDDEAAGRAVDTLIEGLADNQIRDRYHELGSLCVPHLRTASARSSRKVAVWLADTTMAAVSSRSASPAWLAGTDRDTCERIALRRAAQADSLPGPQVCTGCLAAARSENSCLTRILRTGYRGHQDRQLLCAGHLNDLIALADQPDAAPLLGWQVGCLVAGLARPARSWRALGDTAGRLRSRGRRVGCPDRCPICLTAANAAQQAIDDLRSWLRASHQVPGCRVPLCVRHLQVLRILDPWASHVTGPDGLKRAETLATELDEAFRKNTWTHRLETKGPEMMAWQRAVAFLDGGVFCGSATRQTLRRAASGIVGRGLGGPGDSAAHAVPPVVAYLTGGGPTGRIFRPKVNSMMSLAA